MAKKAISVTQDLTNDHQIDCRSYYLCVGLKYLSCPCHHATNNSDQKVILNIQIDIHKSSLVVREVQTISWPAPFVRINVFFHSCHFSPEGGGNWLVSRVVTVINLQKLPSTKIQYSYSSQRQKVKQTQDSRWNINLHFILHGWAYILMTTWAFHFMIGVDKNISTISTKTSMIWILKLLKQYDPNYIFYFNQGNNWLWFIWKRSWPGWLGMTGDNAAQGVMCGSGRRATHN